ncbi:MAG: cytochrome P450 [Hyphomicrobiales bacterium]|nr:cytochrome P450 [Hyphomicrobiales bacterium]
MQGSSVLCSVVITAFNYGQYLRRAIESVVAQGVDGIEIIVVDDGSQDETRAVALGFGERIRYVQQSHAGPFAAARTGFRLARASRIVFVDADDRLRPGALQHLLAAAAAHPQAALVLGRVCSVDQTRGTVVHESGVALSADPMANFRRFCHGELQAPIAGGLIDRMLLSRFDRDGFDYPSSMDLAILGLGLLKGCIQIDHYTLDVFAHAGRLREDIHYIDRSALRLAEILFDADDLPPACRTLRSAFVGFLERERTRAYYHAGWYASAWRSYARALAAAPKKTLLNGRNLRRGIVSLACAALRRDEGPVAAPPSHWLFGHRRDFYVDPIGFTGRAVERLRTNIRLDLRKRTYLIVGARDVEQVLRRGAVNFQPAGISTIFPAFAGSLLGTPHPRHEPMRRWLAPYFNAKALDAFIPTIDAILKRRVAELPAGKGGFDLAPLVRSINFEIASSIVLGPMPPEMRARLDVLMSKSHSYSSRLLRSSLALPAWVPLRSRRVIRRAEQEIDAMFAALFERPYQDVPTSLLEQMLAEHRCGRGPSLRDIRYTGAGLLLAVCEPVAVTTTVALHLLGRNAILQQQIVDEIAGPGARLPSQSELRAFDLLNRFIDEVHRLDPAEWLLTREVVQAERLPSGLLLRSGDRVMISVRALHHNAAYFPDPERCDPDRFKSNACKSSTAYLPFGAGVTACLGQSLARVIIAMTLMAILSVRRVVARSENIVLDSPNCFSVAFKEPVAVEFHERGMEPTPQAAIGETSTGSRR